MGHNYIGHNYIGRRAGLGHKYIGHNYIGRRAGLGRDATQGAQDPGDAKFAEQATGASRSAAGIALVDRLSILLIFLVALFFVAVQQARGRK